MLLEQYGVETVRMLTWVDARAIDEHFFNYGGPYCRADYGFPRIGDAVLVGVRRMRVFVCALLTFNAQLVFLDSASSSSDSEGGEDLGDRL